MPSPDLKAVVRQGRRRLARIRWPQESGAALFDSVRARHPRFATAVAADARVAAIYHGIHPGPGRLRTGLLVLQLLWTADAFPALVAYRARCALSRRHVPVLPQLLHRWSMASAQVCIGDPVHIEPGLYIAHGQVVIDGIVSIGRGVVVFPWVTVGLRSGDYGGPTIQNGAHLGSGSKVIGPVTVGRKAVVGANAVVTRDVPDGVTVVGQPARPVGRRDIDQAP